MVRPFRFGIQASGPAGAGERRDLARTAEDLGYATLTMADHLDDRLGPVAGLMAAADATTTLRIGSLVFTNDFRHPVVLAKEAATLDLLSGGRFELGPAFGLSGEEALASPHALADLVEEIVDDLEERRERFGISYIGLDAEWMDDLAPVVAKLAGT